jgi:hypothetical protein
MRKMFTLLSTSLLLACQSNPAPKKDPPQTTLTQKTPESKPAPAATTAPISASTPMTMMASAPGSTSMASSWLETPIPVRNPDEPDMMDHASVIGWSKDSTEFMYCVPAGGIVGDICTYQDAAKNTQKLIKTTNEKDPDNASATKEKEVKARQDKMGYAASSAPLTGALISWKEIPGSFDDEIPMAKLSVMVHSLDKKKEAAVANIELRGASIHPEAIQVSLDGKYLAIVAHSYMGEYSDQFGITIVPVENLAKLVK